MTSAATQMPVPAPRGRKVAVISSHLDDAILSLGATIAGWTCRGRRVIVVTVLANDPDSPGGPSSWDQSAGFTTSKEAAQSRRGEDARACAILGADPEWLP